MKFFGSMFLTAAELSHFLFITFVYWWFLLKLIHTKLDVLLLLNCVT